MSLTETLKDNYFKEKFPETIFPTVPDTLCKTIRALYPDIGICGVDLFVSLDVQQAMWLIHLKKDKHELKHFLSTDDANKCLDGKECVSLGLEISQLLHNIKGEQF